MNEPSQGDPIDALLQEYFQKKAPPPNLAHQVVERSSQLSAERLERLRQVALEVAASTPSSPWHRQPPHIPTVNWIAGLSIAATLLLGLAWAWRDQARQVPPSVVPSVAMTPGPAAATAPSPDKAFVQPPTSSPAPHSPARSLDLPAFANTNPKDKLPNPSSPSRSQIPAIDSEAVVQVIDQQLEHLWEVAAIQPTARVDTRQWTDRVQQWLGVPDATTLPAPPKNLDSVAQRWRWLASLPVDIDRFADRWSTRLGRKWQIIAPPQNDLSSSDAFRQWIARQLIAGRSILDIQQRILSIDPEDAGAQSIASLWIPTNLDSKGILEKTCQDFLGISVGCSRCHDQPGFSQADYWSLVAVQSTLSFEKPGAGTQQPTWKVIPAKSSFYERPDGTVAQADATLPGEGSPSEWSDLSGWVLRHPNRPKEMVNWVWQEAFGEPLVPSEFIEESGEGNARRELLDFLAAQWTAHGESLPVLVGWISASAPWLLAEEPMLVSSRLLEPDDQNRDRLIRRRLFASWAPGNQKSDSIPIAQLDRWLDHTSEGSSTDLESRQRLAQPATSLPPPTLSPLGKQELPEIFASIERQLELLDAPVPEVKGWIDRIARSKLAWDQQVDHVLLSNGIDSSDPWRGTAGRLRLLYPDDSPRALLALWLLSRSTR
jgi:hypothetical protein